MTASDMRNDPATRRKCHSMLERLQPGLFVSIGMASDYMQECVAFLRQFEKDFDFAQMHHKLESFTTRMHRLFLDATVLNEVEGDDVVQTGWQNSHHV